VGHATAGQVELTPGCVKVEVFRFLSGQVLELCLKKVELSKDVVVQACAFHLSV
jgi:hypothetical protein